MFHVRYVRCNYKDALNKTDVDKQELVDENIHCLTQVNSFVHKGISGIIAVILIILGMLIAAKWRLAQFDMKAPIIKDVVFIIELISMLALTILVILPIVHEFLHAIVYPGHAEKIIYISSHGVCYTYCEAKMSKGRMILMLILSLLTLCILPFAVLMLLVPVISAESIAIILMSILYMVFSSLHDIGSALVIAIHVPARASVFVQGRQLYWEKSL